VTLLNNAAFLVLVVKWIIIHSIGEIRVKQKGLNVRGVSIIQFVKVPGENIRSGLGGRSLCRY